MSDFEQRLRDLELHVAPKWIEPEWKRQQNAALKEIGFPATHGGNGKMICCARPKCDVWFTPNPSRPRQRYCSFRCGHVVDARNYRNRKRREQA